MRQSRGVADEAGTARRVRAVANKARWGVDIAAEASMVGQGGVGQGTWVADETSMAWWGADGSPMRRACQVGSDSLPILPRWPKYSVVGVQDS